VSGANIGVDFVGISGVLEFGEGENVKTIQVELVNDAAREENEEFPVWLSNLTGATIGIFDPVATVVIEDNDPGIHFDPLEVRVAEGEPEVRLTVWRGTDSVAAFTVDYATQAFMSSGQVGHQSVSGTIEFGPGELSKTVPIALLGDDALWEGDDEFEVVLRRPTGVGVLDPNRSAVWVVIVDNDVPVRWETHWAGEEFPAVSGLEAVTWGGGRYVAVGGEWAVVSEDARAWSAQRVPPGFKAADVIWGNEEYLAVGAAGVWRSADGLNWSSVPVTPPRSLRRVSYGEGWYVALDFEGRVWMTSDLFDWTSELLGGGLEAVAYGDAGFVVVGGQGEAWHWRPGARWEALGRIASGGLGAAAWGDQGYVTITRRYDQVLQTEFLEVFNSRDGRTWETNRVDGYFTTPDSLVFGGGAYVGVDGGRGTRLRWESGRWVAEGFFAGWGGRGGFGMRDLVYGAAGFVGASGGIAWVSADGLTWNRLWRPDLGDIHLAAGEWFVTHQSQGLHWSYFDLRSSADAQVWRTERTGGWGSELASLNGVVGYVENSVLHLRSTDGTWREANFQERGSVRGAATGAGGVGGGWKPL
jgi:hypothetical protein